MSRALWGVTGGAAAVAAPTLGYVHLTARSWLPLLAVGGSVVVLYAAVCVLIVLYGYEQQLTPTQEVRE